MCRHLIRYCCRRFPVQMKGDELTWLLRVFEGHIYRMATHPYGCRVVQRMVENLRDDQVGPIVTELLAHAGELVHSAYGNYTLQALAERGSREQRSALVRVVAGNVVAFSQHKFASNVVERCLEFGTAAEKAALVDEILQPTLAMVAARPGRTLPDEDSGAALTPLQVLLRHEFGNFVCQRAIAESTDAQRAQLIELIRQYAPVLRRYPYGKHILARLDKLSSRSLLTLPVAPPGGGGNGGIAAASMPPPPITSTGAVPAAAGVLAAPAPTTA
jgi:pumilio RNA-binding family